jgi:uncharacterized membrane protein
MWRVQYKPNNASQTWHTLGSYGSEQSALSNAGRIVGRYFMVRVVDPNGHTVFSG